MCPFYNTYICIEPTENNCKYVAISVLKLIFDAVFFLSCKCEKKTDYFCFLVFSFFATYLKCFVYFFYIACNNFFRNIIIFCVLIYYFYEIICTFLYSIYF